jgi:radical SAM-linked protein
MWQRILVRSGLPLVFSAGFNPRPRVSLPLPRPVGVQSEEELLCVHVAAVMEQEEEWVLCGRMNRLLPEGCKVSRIQWVCGRCPMAQEVSYEFRRGPAIPETYWAEQISRCRGQMASGEPILLKRQSPKHASKSVDLRTYIMEFNGHQDDLRIRCRIDQGGGVRPEELLEWLTIRGVDLAGPPRRTGVVWIHN